MLRPLSILVLCATSACTYASGDSRVLVTSDPAGAEILVDGENTGATTPIHVDLDGFFGDDHEITLRLPGHAPETRLVRHHRTWYTSRWNDGTDDVVFPNPLFWTLGDWFTPFAVKWQYVPHELFVRLYPEGEGPVPSPKVDS